jgi:hypothetical protein
MKNKNYITKYLIIILPLLLINLNAQDQVDPLEKETVAEEATAEAEEAESTEAATEEVDEIEELAVKEELGFSFGFAGSVGLINGTYITNTPIGGSLVINTPWGFKIGNALDFGISLTVGSYNGEGNNESLNALLYGIGGNLTLVNLVFAEGHAGQIGEGPGIRGFAGVSLEYLMKKGLNLPVNILVGGEGFFLTKADELTGNSTYWGGLGVRLDYDF